MPNKKSDGSYGYAIGDQVFRHGGGTQVQKARTQAQKAHEIVRSQGGYHAGSSWDESKHPRQPSGNEQGGEFAPKGMPGGGENLGFDLTPEQKALVDRTFAKASREGGKTTFEKQVLVYGYAAVNPAWTNKALSPPPPGRWGRKTGGRS